MREEKSGMMAHWVAPGPPAQCGPFVEDCLWHGLVPIDCMWEGGLGPQTLDPLADLAGRVE